MAGLRTVRRLVTLGALAGLTGLGCQATTVDGGTGFMVLGFGTYTVTAEIPSGNVNGASIMLDADVTWDAAFFTSDSMPDERVMEPRFRLDAAPLDTTHVRCVPGTAFSGTLERKTPGTTEIHFSLYDSEIGGYSFTAVVPITVN